MLCHLNCAIMSGCWIYLSPIDIFVGVCRQCPDNSVCCIIWCLSDDLWLRIANECTLKYLVQCTIPQGAHAKKFNVVAYLPEWRSHRRSIPSFFLFFFHAILTAFQNLRRQRLSLPNFIDQILDQPCFLGNEHYLKHVPIHAVLPQIRRRELGSRLPTCHTPVTVLAGAEARWNNHCPRSTAATGINETRTRSHQGDGVQADGLLWGQWPERRSVAE